MQDDNIFEDSSRIQILTPYRKLRKLRGWSLEEAAEQFTVSRHTLINIELGRMDCPKWLVREMDKVYGCNGELIAYWLPRFSIAPIEQPSAWRRIAVWMRTSLSNMTRCMTNVLTAHRQKLMKILRKS